MYTVWMLGGKCTTSEGGRIMLTITIQQAPDYLIQISWEADWTDWDNLLPVNHGFTDCKYTTEEIFLCPGCHEYACWCCSFDDDQGNVCNNCWEHN